MQDAAAFYRNRAWASFWRRRKYPLNSEDRKHCVKEARQFIRYVRALEGSDIDYLDIPPLDKSFFTNATADWPPRKRAVLCSKIPKPETERSRT